MDETMNAVIQAISTVGFPIVCCGVLFYMLYKYIIPLSAVLTEFKGAIEEQRKSNEELTKAVTDLRDAVQRIGEIEQG